MKIDRQDRDPQLPSRIAALILQQVVDERLKPGDRLPTEQALAERFGVSRNVLGKRSRGCARTGSSSRAKASARS